MQRITIHPNSKGGEFIKKLRADKEERKAKLFASFPPDDIMQLMNEKVKEVDAQNDGTLNKSTFRLGMICMWFLLQKHKYIKDGEEIPKDSSRI